MPTRWEMNVAKQAKANAKQRADTEKYLWERDHYMTKEERKEIERIRLYFDHKERGSLGTYYLLYPMDKGARAFYARQNREDERER